MRTTGHALQLIDAKVACRRRSSALPCRTVAMCDGVRPSAAPGRAERRLRLARLRRRVAHSQAQREMHEFTALITKQIVTDLGAAAHVAGKVRNHVRACVRACVRARVCVCVCVCVLVRACACLYL